MSNIAPAKMRREAALCSLYKKCDLNQNSLLFELRKELPENRLKSKKPPWLKFDQNFNVNDEWRK